jgi:hypothetical protein
MQAEAGRRRQRVVNPRLGRQYQDLDIRSLGADTVKFGTISVVNRLLDARKLENCTFDHSFSEIFVRGKRLVRRPYAKKLQIPTTFDSDRHFSHVQRQVHRHVRHRRAVKAPILPLIESRWTPLG